MALGTAPRTVVQGPAGSAMERLSVIQSFIFSSKKMKTDCIAQDFMNLPGKALVTRSAT